MINAIKCPRQTIADILKLERMPVCFALAIRGKVTYEAIGDIDLCRTLEEYIGRDEVIKLIDKIAGKDVRFDSYPLDSEYLPKLRAAIIEKIKEYI